MVVNLNEELNGIELTFDSKPERSVLESLKENGFKWNPKKQVWYAKQTTERLDFVNNLSGTDIKQDSISNAKIPQSMWDRTRTDNIEVPSFNDSKDYSERIRNFRNTIKRRFPEVNLSITHSYSYGLSVDVLSSPYDRKETIVLDAIMDYIRAYADACNIECYHHDVRFSYDYKQVDISDKQLADLDNFNSKHQEFLKAEEERFQQEMEQRRKQEEEERILSEKIDDLNCEKINEICRTVIVNELDEEHYYYVNNAIEPCLNKNSSIEEYVELMDEYGYRRHDYHIEREIYFDNEELYNYFSENLLLHDMPHEFYAKVGGSGTNDKRIEDWTDYAKMSEDEQENVKWFSNGIAVYLKDELKFIVNTEGFGYARYVGLPDKDTYISKEENVRDDYKPVGICNVIDVPEDLFSVYVIKENDKIFDVMQDYIVNTKYAYLYEKKYALDALEEIRKDTSLIGKKLKRADFKLGLEYDSNIFHPKFSDVRLGYGEGIYHHLSRVINSKELNNDIVLRNLSPEQIEIANKQLEYIKSTGEQYKWTYTRHLTPEQKAQLQMMEESLSPVVKKEGAVMEFDNGLLLEFYYSDEKCYNSNCDSIIDFALYDGDLNKINDGKMEYNSKDTAYSNIKDAVFDVIEQVEHEALKNGYNFTDTECSSIEELEEMILNRGKSR